MEFFKLGQGPVYVTLTVRLLSLRTMGDVDVGICSTVMQTCSAKSSAAVAASESPAALKVHKGGVAAGALKCENFVHNMHLCSFDLRKCWVLGGWVGAAKAQRQRHNSRGGKVKVTFKVKVKATASRAKAKAREQESKRAMAGVG